jgi:peptidoglycan/xylan/chitin deacetylase (PgdA/CDA1 family)
MKPTISLTFDDGLLSQLQNAICALRQYNMKATFFLPALNMLAIGGHCDAWRKVAQEGHEIGSHSFTHNKPYDMGSAELYHEVVESRNALERQLETTVTSFAYPYTIVTPALRLAVSTVYKQARGGHDPETVHIPASTVVLDVYNVRCHQMQAGCFYKLLYAIDLVRRLNAWGVFMFHGIGNTTDWDNVSAYEFQALLHMLSLFPDVQVLTFAQGAEAYRNG